MAALWSSVKELARFGLIGVLATATHIVIAESVRYGLSAPAHLASFCGFVPAFGVSYLGHRYFTFAGSGAKGASLPKFLAIALSGFLASLLALTAVKPLFPVFALTLSILAIPAITFVLAKFWAFRSRA